MRYIIKVAALVLLYFVLGRISLALDAVSGFAAYFWIPTGLALAVSLIFGYRYAPGIFWGAFFLNLSVGAPLLVAVGIAFGNTLEAVIGTYLIRKLEINKTLSSHNDILGLAFYAAFVSTMLSATIGVASLYLGKIITFAGIPSTWSAWWIGDMVSVLLFTPFILFWFYKPNFIENNRKNLELVTLLILTLLLGFLIFGGFDGTNLASSQVIYLIFPLIIWAAIRFDQKITASIVLIFSLIAVLGTAQGYGPFASGKLGEGLYLIQSFMGITAITSLLLAVAFEESREADRRKDDIISIVSHELKTPITTIKGYLQLTQKNLKGKRNEKNLMYLEKISIQSNRLVGLVNDLLDLSRIQRHTFEIKRKKFLLKELLDRVIEEMKIASKNHKIILKGNSSKKVYADPERIEQVLINLISNAVKYSPDRKKIYVEVRPMRGRVQISVTDQGIGIDEKHGRRIFDLFYRAVDSSKLQGFGIGLYFSRYIIRQHGGNIWFRSKRKKGTTFFFTIPYRFKK